jgi:3-dehydrosphinganine reductase
LTIPKVTRDFVGTDGLKPEEAAKQLLKGIQYGQFLITSDFIGTLAASLNSGLVPGDFLILDLLRVALGWVPLISTIYLLDDLPILSIVCGRASQAS